MKKKILSLLLVISVLLLSTSIIPVSGEYTTPIFEVWEVGDWVTFEVFMGLTVLQYRYSFIDSENGSLFTIIFNGKEIVPTNTSNNIPSNNTEENLEGTTIDPYIRNLLTSKLVPSPFFNLSMWLNDIAILKIKPLFYESNTLIHIDGNATVIPVTGVTYEYSNISETQPYNYTTYNWTDYSSETTLVNVHANYSIQLEIHEPTGILVSCIVGIYLNTTIPLFGDIPYSIGTYMRLIDSHGVFESLEETITESVTTETSEIETMTETETTTTKNTPFGLGIIGMVLIGIVCVYMRRKRRKGS